ncbi:MAG TPA: alpha-amylase family glycosyl hydrolase, partial [Myxococcota bacterium]
MVRPPHTIVAVIVAVLAVSALSSSPARAEVILQYFETPWTEIEARMPEIAAAGYDALWLPPPTKGSEGIRDVGFAVYDRFDLGDVNQRGTTPTRYGSKDELQSLVATAHKFGIRVYFDVVMNHNGNPDSIENVGGPPFPPAAPVDINGFPGTSVWDYHLLPARVPDGGSGGTCHDGSSGCFFCALQV